MGRKIVTGAILLIGGYLVLTNFTGFVKDTGAASSGGVGLVKAFQGR